MELPKLILYTVFSHVQAIYQSIKNFRFSGSNRYVDVCGSFCGCVREAMGWGVDQAIKFLYVDVSTQVLI